MTRQELLDAFTPIYDEFRIMKFAEANHSYPKLFDVIDDPTKDWKFNAMSGLGAWEAVDEDTDDGLDNFEIGCEGTFSLGKYRKYFYVSFEVNEQIEYASLKSKSFKAEALGAGGRSRCERSSLAKLPGGFTTAGADAVMIFSNSHPKNTTETGILYDNLLAGPLSHDNLEAAQKQIAHNHFDMDGEPIQLDEKPYIVYAPSNNGTAMRLLSDRANDNMPNQEKYGINIYAGKYTPLESVFISAAPGMGGSDTAWYIVYPGMENLKFIWGGRPTFASWIDNKYHRYYFDGWMWFSCGIVDWRGLFGSTGL